MSSKAQTTRNKIQGIYTDDNAQIVFVDTPGIHKPHNELDEYMDQAALSTFNEVDAILFMISGIDKKRAWGSIHHGPIEERQKNPFIWLLTKLTRFIQTIYYQ